VLLVRSFHYASYVALFRRRPSDPRRFRAKAMDRSVVSVCGWYFFEIVSRYGGNALNHSVEKEELNFIESLLEKAVYEVVTIESSS
jgi:predicted trehalose synthase